MVDAMVPHVSMQYLCADLFDWRPGTLISGAAIGGVTGKPG